MNVACTACSARYAIPDGKITGRKARITCKRCATRLLVDGTVDPPQVTADGSTPPAALPAEDRYLLALSSERQESFDVAGIVAAFGDGRLDESTFAWRRGMSDWKPLFEIEAIARALAEAGYAPSPRYDDEDEPTRVFDSEALGPVAWNEPARWNAERSRDPLRTGQWREPLATARVPEAPPPPDGSWQERGTVDEDEVTRIVAPLEERALRAELEERALRAELEERAAPLPEGERPGQRAETSVLFSLRALAADSAAPPPNPSGSGHVSDDVLTGGASALGTLRADPNLLAPPSSPPRRPVPPPLPVAAQPRVELDASAPVRPRTRRAAPLLLLGLVCAALGAVYLSGHLPVVVRAASNAIDRLTLSR